MNARVRIHAAPPRTRSHAVPLLLVAALVIGGACWLAQRGGAPEVPQALAPEAISALPERELIYRVTTDLRLALAARGERPDWLALPAAARTVLALSWVDRETVPGSPRPRFPGFAVLVADADQAAPSFSDVAEAYDAIGAPQCAGLVRSAGETASALTPGAAAPFAQVDRRFAAQIEKDRTHALLRTYIRANALELAGAARR